MKQFRIMYSQEFDGEVLDDSYIRIVDDESELPDIANALYSDPHVVSVQWEEVQ